MNLLDISNVSKHYAKHTALDQVSLSVPKGSVFGLLGPNGAGKTSLIRIITQITVADEGTLQFNGEPLQEKHILQMGYLPEERGLYKKMQVGEQLLYLARLKGLSKKDAEQKLKVWGERFGIREWWKKNIEDLSKGMQQKVQFIATVLHEPELIILDEPFSGFDPINANLIKEEILRLRENGATVIFSTHRMESVEELCDHVALINHSKKVLDGPKEVIKEQFRNGLFHLSTNLPIQPLPPQFELLACVSVENHFKSKVRILEGSSNDLLQAVMAQETIIHSLIEHIPSMNEIFIKVVQES